MKKSRPIRRLAVLAKCHPPTLKPLKRLLAAAARLRMSLHVEKAVAEWAGLKDAKTFLPHDIPSSCHAVAVLGGDGTLLRAARLAAGRFPLLGVNTGNMGFLTSVPAKNLAAALRAMQSGGYEVDQRRMLRVTLLRRGRAVASYHALNDAVVHQGSIARVLSLTLHYGGEFLTQLRADGVIAATPTGSTAYSLAAGGAVVHPALSAMLVTPIAPHSLSFRPLVLPDTLPLRIEMADGDGDVHLSVDGQTSVLMKRGDAVLVERCLLRTKLIRLPGERFFGVLRRKLSWGAR